MWVVYQEKFEGAEPLQNLYLPLSALQSINRGEFLEGRSPMIGRCSYHNYLPLE